MDVGNYQITQDDIEYCDALIVLMATAWGRVADDDAIQAGREGMCIAAKYYNPSKKKVKFMTWANKWIKGCLFRHLFNPPNSKGYPYYACVMRGGPVSEYIDDVYNKTKRNIESEYVKFEDVQNAFKSMHPNMRKAFIGKALDGKTYAQTGRELGYSRKSLESFIKEWRDGRYTYTGESKEGMAY
jgi:RNA polymerase sigma factor (sigma-70 family)